jgi:predicted dehydrogenase
VPTPLPITDRPVRLGVIGCGQIAELCLPPYAARDDVEVVALCDPDTERVERWRSVFPHAQPTSDIDALLATAPDVVDILVPTPLHGDVATRVLDAGVHVQVQKPIARTLADAERMLAAAARTRAHLRVLEDYLFYPPLVQLRELVAGGEVGEPVGLHMKIVASGRGGWDVPVSSYVWQFEQSRDGRGILTFDHGWHQLAVAHWSHPAPELAPEILIDAPATMTWEHENGVRGVLDIVLARDMFFHSDYYTGDERVEVTGTRGFARCNRISSRGLQEPAVVLYRDGETREYHAIDDRPPDAFAAMTAAGIDFFTTAGASPPPLLDGATARAVLQSLLTGLESSARGGVLLDVD